jgi:plastocyanin
MAIAALIVAVTACGGGDVSTGGASPSSSAPVPARDCPAAGTALEIEAEDVAFDTDCLAAPADVPFTVEMKNRDELVAHNFSIYTQAGEELFTSETFQGNAERTHRIDALDPGTYLFRCDVHPGTMKGTLVVE